jgi:hypothetical protein
VTVLTSETDPQRLSHTLALARSLVGERANTAERGKDLLLEHYRRLDDLLSQATAQAEDGEMEYSVLVSNGEASLRLNAANETQADLLASRINGDGTPSTAIKQHRPAVGWRS